MSAIRQTYNEVIRSFPMPDVLSTWMAVNRHLFPTGASQENAPTTSHILSKWLEISPNQRKDPFNASRLLDRSGVPAHLIPEVTATLLRANGGGMTSDGFVPKTSMDMRLYRASQSMVVRPPNPQAVRDAIASSRPGILPIPRHQVREPGIPSQTEKKNPLLDRIAQTLKSRDIDLSRYKFQALGVPLQLAKYDATLPFQSSMQRVTASNYQTFVEHMKKVLMQSGIIPQDVSPAIHDVNGQTRVSLFASGTYRNPAAPGTAAAWTGMLGRQPGMLSFQSSPTGADSIYKLAHGDSDTVQQVLSANGINSRTMVPRDKSFEVYVYDQGRQQREAMAAAATQLGVPVEEWRGTGTPVGGKQEDMGRSQYRDAINASESGQPARMAKDGYGNIIGHDPETQAIIEGWKERPYDFAPGLILTDRLEDLGHPMAQLLRWNLTHGHAAVLGSTGGTQETHPHLFGEPTVASPLTSLIQRGGPVLGNMFNAAMLRGFFPETFPGKTITNLRSMSNSRNLNVFRQAITHEMRAMDLVPGLSEDIRFHHPEHVSSNLVNGRSHEAIMRTMRSHGMTQARETARLNDRKYVDATRRYVDSHTHHFPEHDAVVTPESGGSM